MEPIKNLISQQTANPVEILENFSHIQLTEDETESALREARKEKHYRLAHEAWKAKISEPVQYPHLNSMQLKELIIRKGNKLFGEFIQDDYNSEIINHLCLYFSGESQFEAIYGQNSLEKGIMLVGGIGRGKTALMSLFQENSFRSFAMVNCSKIAEDYSDQGTAVMDKYSTLIQSSRPDLTFGQKFLGICFDDLGTEENKKHFGNQANVMAELIVLRHANAYQLRGQTHVTTNLTSEDIDNLYGHRVRSRMREMFNVIAFGKDSIDRRK